MERREVRRNTDVPFIGQLLQRRCFAVDHQCRFSFPSGRELSSVNATPYNTCKGKTVYSSGLRD